MFQVKAMRAQDYPFATELANTMDWNMAEEDFAFMATLEPDGCLVAYKDTERIGIATCVSYGRVGWFGNLIVNETYRKKGVGRLLVNHAVNLLRSKGVQTVGLYAYPYLVPFYSSLGFQFDEEFSVLSTEKLGSVAADNSLRRIGKGDVAAVEAIDRQCFGGDRKKLLESIILDKGNLSYCTVENNTIVGYVAATVYETMAWVGPLMCKSGRFDDATALTEGVLSKLAGKKVYAALPKASAPLLDAFRSFGFIEDFSVSRMFLGESTSKNCIYLAESLERG